MTNIAFLPTPQYTAGESIIVAPDGEILAKEPSLDEDGIIEAEIPIAEFRKGRVVSTQNSETDDFFAPASRSYSLSSPAIVTT